MITVTMPGTCGELIQGWSDEWAEPVLVSCPVALYNRISVEVRPDRPGVTVAEADHCSKIRQAALLALDYLERPGWGVKITRTSQLIPGRGMASSTADVVGVIMGLAEAVGRPLLAAELVRLACRIEPSDSTMLAGLALLAYRDSGQFCQMGPPPTLPLLMLDPGSTVDTLTYNAQLDLAAVRQLGPSTHVALEWLGEGLRRADGAAIGAAATLSAFSYQKVSYSPLLEQAEGWAKDTHALGLVRAHSGSVIGLLYPPQTDLAGPGRWLAARFDGIITPTHLTGGGGQLEQPSSSLLCEGVFTSQSTPPAMKR
jgi:L-threonine kinase